MDFLKKQEQQFINFFENAPIAAAMLDFDFRFQKVNPQFCKILGCQEEDIQHLTIEDIIEQSDCAIVIAGLQRMLKEPSFVFNGEIRVKTHKTQIVWCKFSVTILRGENNESICFLPILIDITNAKNIFEEVRKLTMAVEQSANTIVITDICGNIEFVNKAFEKVTGYTKSEALGKNPRILKTDFLDKSVYKKMWETISSGKVWIGEFHNRKKDGAVYWEKAMITPITDEHGKIINYLSVKEDITKQKEYEQKLKDSKRQAESANKMKSEFLANMSHEIRTPMNAIMGFTDLLLEAKDISVNHHEMLEIIKRSGNHLLNLINDILDLSKIEAGKIKLEEQPFSLKKLLLHINSMLSVKAQEKKIFFELKIADNVPDMLMGDEHRINQALVNIAGNAIKFTDTGGITLECNYENDNAVIKIIDTGIGISNDRRTLIFNAFEQGDASTTRKYGGTGLGLTITKKLIEFMNGRITVESEYKKGSVFTVFLPLVKASSALGISDDYDFDKEDLCGKFIVSDNMVQNWFKNLSLAMGDSQLCENILSETIRKLPQKLKKLENAITLNIKKDINFLAHELKGISANLRMKEIFDMLILINKEIDKENYNIDRIKNYYNQLKKIVEIIPPVYFKEKEIDKDRQDSENNVQPKKKSDEENAVKILVAEDNFTNQKLIKLIINKFGYDCDIADNGKIAVDMLEKERYDLLLLDMQMPVMDGLETIKYIRASEKFKELYVVAVTANAFKGDAEKYINAGCNAYMAKPIDKEILREKIHNGLIAAKNLRKLENKIDEILKVGK